MTEHELLTPELKKQVLKTWAERSRLRAIELVEAELKVSHVDAIAIIDSLEPEYLKGINTEYKVYSVGGFDFRPDLVSLTLAGLFSFGFFCFCLAGMDPEVVAVVVFGTIIVGMIAYSIGAGMGGG